jgi:aromatic ring-cleaving dioxygenase
MIQEGTSQPISKVCWFHGTRVLDADTLREGVRPINEQIDLIWEGLFGLSSKWITQEKWLNFRYAVETDDSSASSIRYRHRLATPSDFGPHAVLIREILLRSNQFGAIVDYLNAPETVEDICASFAIRFHKDLFSLFQQRSKPCVVKFWDTDFNNRIIGAALAYAYCFLHDEPPPWIACNECFDATGKTIHSAQILEVETL